MVRLLKKAIKWYCAKCSETYAWTPSCMIPYIRPEVKRKKAA